MQRYFSAVLRIISLVFVVMLIGSLPVYAQLGNLSGNSTTSMEDMMRLMQLSGQANSASITPSDPVDDVIRADQYRVGPGDVLVYVAPDMHEQSMMITPENTLILPRFGEINVFGKTLSQVKQDVQRLVSARIPGAKVFIILQKPRTVYVNVRGNVPRQGAYTVSASMRVSTFVELIKNGTVSVQNATPSRTPQQGKQTEQQMMSASTGYYVAPYSIRNVSLFRRDGSTETIDAIASSLGIKGSDQLVREGDEIYVPFETDNFAQVSVGGKVRRPAILPFRKGDKLSFLWKAGYGFAEDADTTQISVYFPQDPKPQRIAISALKSGAMDREIVSGTRIVAEPRITAGEEVITLSVTGQVHSPGTLSLPKSMARLKQALESAGGMLPDAYAPLAYIVRKDMLNKNVSSEYETAQSMLSSDLTAFDTARYKMDILLRRPIVSCNIDGALRDSVGKDNIELQNGDMIVIPTDPKNVYVFGGVNKPGFVTFEKGRDLAWYVEQAGGYSGFSEKERTRIIKGSLRNWVDPTHSPTIESGDQIFIPRQPDYPPTLALQRRTVDLQGDAIGVQREAVEAQREATIVQKDNLARTLELQRQGLELQSGALSLQKWSLILGIVGTLVNGFVLLYTLRNNQQNP
jgi:polysaccharide export outer membrane protein